MNDIVEHAGELYERILDNLEFMQKVMELYDIPEPIATKLTETHWGLCEDYKSAMQEIIEHTANIGGITRVNK